MIFNKSASLALAAVAQTVMVTSQFTLKERRALSSAIKHDTDGHLAAEMLLKHYSKDFRHQLCGNSMSVV